MDFHFDGRLSLLLKIARTTARTVSDLEKMPENPLVDVWQQRLADVRNEYLEAAYLAGLSHAEALEYLQ
jgi:hypothetical protein